MSPQPPSSLSGLALLFHQRAPASGSSNRQNPPQIPPAAMAAPPPPPPLPPVANLPKDIQRLIMIRIPCSADRAPMSLVCRAWRDMVRLHKGHPPPLPWLLLPTEPALPHRVACVLAGCRVHHLLDIDPPGARCFGSHDGAWLLLHDGRGGGNHARNARTGLVEPLPVGLLGRNGQRFDDMVVHAAALSTTPDDAACIAPAIVTRGDVLDWFPHQRRCIALWRRGWELAHEHVPPPAYSFELRVEDLIFHAGAFHMVTRGNHLRVCTPEIQQEDDDDLLVNWETRRFRPGGVHYDDRDLFVRGRYLVVSRGELLLVLRFTLGPNQPTSTFKVFQATASDATDDYFPVADYPWAWRELETLDGRTLFVGQGHSRSYETNADHYPTFNDAVYFMDDGEYSQAQDFNRGLDNGKWSDGRAGNCFPLALPRTSPAWVLP